MSSVDDEIRRLLRQINSLERSIDAERNALWRAGEDRRKFESRLGDIEAVRSMLTRTFDDEVGDVRACQNGVKNKLRDATAGLNHEEALITSIEKDLEQHVENDAYGSQMLESLRQEINRCESEIQEARSRESYVRSNIDRYQTQRTSLVYQARRLADQPDATVLVMERAGY